MAASDLTVPDVVVLSLLTERPMYGYELNRVLEEREVRDWAAISPAQVYYSLGKLERDGAIGEVSPTETSAGPSRRVYAPTAVGRAALEEALGREDWTAERSPPAFLTWLALSTHVGPEVVARQIERRRRFLIAEWVREAGTLAAIRRDEGEMVEVASWMVRLTLRQFATELGWLAALERGLEPGPPRPDPRGSGTAGQDQDA